MSWEQIVVAIWLLVSAMASASAFARDDKFEGGWKTFGIVLSILVTVGFALVLHSGGFW